MDSSQRHYLPTRLLDSGWVLACPDCGAIVLNATLHDLWHDSLRASGGT